MMLRSAGRALPSIHPLDVHAPCSALPKSGASETSETSTCSAPAPESRRSMCKLPRDHWCHQVMPNGGGQACRQQTTLGAPACRARGQSSCQSSWLKSVVTTPSGGAGEHIHHPKPCVTDHPTDWPHPAAELSMAIPRHAMNTHLPQPQLPAVHCGRSVSVPKCITDQSRHTLRRRLNLLPGRRPQL
jgi:hypothetical protein